MDEIDSRRIVRIDHSSCQPCISEYHWNRVVCHSRVEQSCLNNSWGAAVQSAYLCGRKSDGVDITRSRRIYKPDAGARTVWIYIENAIRNNVHPGTYLAVVNVSVLCFARLSLDRALLGVIPKFFEEVLLAQEPSCLHCWVDLRRKDRRAVDCFGANIVVAARYGYYIVPVNNRLRRIRQQEQISSCRIQRQIGRTAIRTYRFLTGISINSLNVTTGYWLIKNSMSQFAGDKTESTTERHVSWLQRCRT